MPFATKTVLASLVLLAGSLLVPASWAQNNSIGPLTLNAAALPAAPLEFLTVTINSGNIVNFTLAPNTAANAGSTTTNVTTAWRLRRGRRAVAVWAYFTSANSALVHQTAGNTTDIPSSAVKIQVNGAGAYNPLTVASPFNAAASGLQIGGTRITFRNGIGTRTDTLSYQIDTTIVPQLPADRYTGTLNIQAQATP